MRKIKAIEYITLNDVFENPAWTVPYWSDDIGAFQDSQLDTTDALLLGRVTYEGFAQAWPNSKDEGAAQMNGLAKQVVTGSLKQLDWNNSHLVPTDNFVASIQALKAQDGQDLLVYGSGQLVRSLLEHDLLDELHLITYPLVLGEGGKLFEGLATGIFELKPLDSRTISKGVQIRSYTRK